MLINHQAHKHTTCALLRQLDAQHHAAATNLLDNSREVCSDSLQASLQIRARFAAATQHILFLNRLNGSNTGSARQLTAAKGRGMQEGCFDKACPRARCADNRTDRHHAAAKRLRAGHKVRRNALMVHAEPFAGTADAGLHLISNQQCALLLADFLHLTQIALRRYDNAALALNRLQNHSSRIFIHSCLNSRRVTILYMRKAFQQRLERVAVHIAASCRQTAKGFAMEGILGCYKFFALRCQTSHLQAALHSLCAAVNEKAVLQLTRSDVCQRLCKVGHRTVEQHLAAHRHSVQLLLHRLDNLRMTMA